MKFLPLGMEEVLHEFLQADFSLQPLLHHLQGLPVPVPQSLGPLNPGGAFLLLLDGHKESIIIKPVCLPMAEGLIFTVMGRLLGKLGISFLEAIQIMLNW